jgi:hypothetical protein
MHFFAVIASVTLVQVVLATPLIGKRSVTCGLALNEVSCDRLERVDGKYCCNVEPPPFDTKGAFVMCDKKTFKVSRFSCGKNTRCRDDSNGEAQCLAG